MIRAAKTVTNGEFVRRKNTGQNASAESRFRLCESDSKCSEIQGREKLEMSEMLRENGTQHQALKKRLEFDWVEGTGYRSSKWVTSEKGVQQESCK